MGTIQMLHVWDSLPMENICGPQQRVRRELLSSVFNFVCFPERQVQGLILSLREQLEIALKNGNNWNSYRCNKNRGCTSLATFLTSAW